jgi:hypothetical protein
MKISLALVHRNRISCSRSWTCLPGRDPRTSRRRSMMESRSTSFSDAIVTVAMASEVWVEVWRGLRGQEGRARQQHDRRTRLSFACYHSVECGTVGWTREKRKCRAERDSIDNVVEMDHSERIVIGNSSGGGVEGTTAGVQAQRRQKMALSPSVAVRREEKCCCRYKVLRNIRRKEGAR